MMQLQVDIKNGTSYLNFKHWQIKIPKPGSFHNLFAQTDNLWTVLKHKSVSIAEVMCSPILL